MYVHLLVHVLCCREKYTYDNFCGVTDADDGMSSCDAELLQLSTTFISQSVFLFCFLFVWFFFFWGEGVLPSLSYGVQPILSWLHALKLCMLYVQQCYVFREGEKDGQIASQTSSD